MRISVKILFYFLIFLSISTTSYAYLAVDPDNIYLGEVGRDMEQKRYILLQNKGEGEIKIIGVINQCGLNLSIPKKDLKKGETSEAVLNFFSSTALGDFKESLVIIYQEEGATKQAFITVSWKTRGIIYNDISISPKRFDFGKVPVNKPINFYVEMTNKGSLSGSVVTIKRDQGINFVTNIELKPGETKILQGNILPSEAGINKKTITFEIKDFTSPIQEVEFNYEATSDIMGSFIELGETERDGNLYKIPVTITANFQSLQVIGIEAPDGEKINISEKTPFYIHKSGKKSFYLILDESKYNQLKNSYFYFNVGVKKQ